MKTPEYDPGDQIFKKIFETNPIGMAFIDPDFYYKKANEAFCQMMGYSEQELKSLRFTDITHPDYLADSIKAVQALLQGKTQVYHTENVISAKRTDYLGAIQISIISDDIEGPMNLITMVENITLRKSMEMQLRNNASLLHEVQKISKVGGWEYEIATKKLTLTSEAFKIFGTTVSNYDEAISHFYHGHRGLIRESIQRALQKGEHYDIEVRFINAHEKQLWVKTSCTPICENGNVIRLIGTLIDITERKQVELEIKRMNIELAESNATKDKFFSIVAHDLRSPFNALLGLTQMISNPDGGLSMSETREIAGRVHKVLISQFDFLQNLLEWSHLQQGRMQYNPVALNVFDSVTKVTDLLIENINRKEIHIFNNIDKGLKIFADQEMIKSIFLNLISNAIKFTHKNGSVTIEAKKYHNFIEISITDTGVGINEDELDKLFQVETIFTKQGTDGEKGTGLGIILCNEMIEKHGGTIEIYSKVNVGTTVTLCLPAPCLARSENCHNPNRED